MYKTMLGLILIGISIGSLIGVTVTAIYFSNLPVQTQPIIPSLLQITFSRPPLTMLKQWIQLSLGSGIKTEQTEITSEWHNATFAEVYTITFLVYEPETQLYIDLYNSTVTGAIGRQVLARYFILVPNFVLDPAIPKSLYLYRAPTTAICLTGPCVLET